MKDLLEERRDLAREFLIKCGAGYSEKGLYHWTSHGIDMTVNYISMATRASMNVPYQYDFSKTVDENIILFELEKL